MYLVAIGVIFAITLGVGAGRLRKMAYGLGFWGTLISVILGFVMFGFLHGIGFALLLVVISLVTWLTVQATGNARLSIEETNPHAIRTFAHQKFTPEVAARESALVAMRDFEALGKILMLNRGPSPDDFMPSMSVYLKMVCTIVLKQGSEVLPGKDKNSYGSAFRAALEAPLGEDDALARLLNKKWYKGLADYMDHSPENLATLTTRDMIPALPLEIEHSEEDSLRRFVEIRASKLSEAVAQLNFGL